MRFLAYLAFSPSESSGSRVSWLPSRCSVSRWLIGLASTSGTAAMSTWRWSMLKRWSSPASPSAIRTITGTQKSDAISCNNVWHCYSACCSALYDIVRNALSRPPQCADHRVHLGTPFRSVSILQLSVGSIIFLFVVDLQPCTMSGLFPVCWLISSTHTIHIKGKGDALRRDAVKMHLVIGRFLQLVYAILTKLNNMHAGVRVDFFDSFEFLRVTPEVAEWKSVI